MILFTRKYIKSLLFGFFRRRDFRNIRFFCFFIGYARSGHSFIGALLDAHPEASFSMEVHALKLVEQGFSRDQIYYIIIRNSYLFKSRLNNIWSGYSYAVPNQYQGTFTRLKVIGDKRGASSTEMFRNDFTIYEKLQSLVKCPVKILHVIRNPYDNISTMISRNLEEGTEPTSELLLEKIEIYLGKIQTITKIKKDRRFDILDIYHEDLIANPETEITRILNFLELKAYPDYIENCSRIVYNEPHKSRFDINWTDDLINLVQSNMDQCTFLKRYSFDN
jgi:hypothetical protein